jgi:hypothetical protein
MAAWPAEDKEAKLGAMELGQPPWGEGEEGECGGDPEGERGGDKGGGDCACPTSVDVGEEICDGRQQWPESAGDMKPLKWLKADDPTFVEWEEPSKEELLSYTKAPS